MQPHEAHTNVQLLKEMSSFNVNMQTNTVQCKKGSDSIATGSQTIAQFVMSPIFHEALKPLWKFMKPCTVDHLRTQTPLII